MQEEAKRNLQLRYDGHAPRQLRAASFVHAFDVWDQVELVASATPQRMQLATATGDVHTGYALFQHLTRTLRLLWPVALVTWLPGVAAVGRRLYPP